MFEESYRLKTDDTSKETVFYDPMQLCQTFCIYTLDQFQLVTHIIIFMALSCLRVYHSNVK